MGLEWLQQIGEYGMYWQRVFQLLPNLYAAEYHL